MKEGNGGYRVGNGGEKGGQRGDTVGFKHGFFFNKYCSRDLRQKFSCALNACMQVFPRLDIWSLLVIIGGH